MTAILFSFSISNFLSFLRSKSGYLAKKRKKNVKSTAGKHPCKDFTLYQPA
jgi:hypothetical protein